MFAIGQQDPGLLVPTHLQKAGTICRFYLLGQEIGFSPAPPLISGSCGDEQLCGSLGKRAEVSQ